MCWFWHNQQNFRSHFATRPVLSNAVASPSWKAQISQKCWLPIHMATNICSTMTTHVKSAKNVILEPVQVQVPSSAEDSPSCSCQISAHLVSTKAFLREAAFVFPGVTLDNLVVISTMQQAKVELVRLGDDVEAEKDRLILSVRGSGTNLFGIHYKQCLLCLVL
jgi:hypothetical protein